MAKAKFDSKKLLKSLTIGQGSILVPHIDSSLDAGKFPATWKIEINNFRKGDTYFHPSSDCFASPKQLYLARKGMIVSPGIGAALRRTFDCGHMWHGYIQAILVEMGFVHPDNVERKLKHVIKGNCIGAGTADLVDVQIPGQGSWLVDIKTMNKTEFEQGASYNTLLKWNAQVSCYLDWLGTDKAFILAICKDSPHALREYQIQKDNTLLAEIYERWIYTQNCIDNNTEPED